MRRGRRMAIAAPFVIAAACAPFTAAEDRIIDAGSPAEDASETAQDARSTDARAEETRPPCGSPRGGPAMVDVGGYCIDATEVTEAQYDAFLTDLDAGYDAGTRAVCAWKRSYLVPEKSTDDEGCSWSPGKTPNVAVACVDWCDADAFCRWAGKRLCGAIDGGTLTAAEVNDPTRDAWYQACSGPSRHRFPYGSALDGGACNTKESNLDVPVDAGGFPFCVGGYAGIVDMSGNVYEHQDACEPGDGGDAGADRCRYRGGSWFEPAAGSSCERVYFEGSTGSARAYRFTDTGFRCCSQ